MQMSEDADCPPSKRYKTESSITGDIDLSALSELPDALLTGQTTNLAAPPQTSSTNKTTQSSYLTDLLTSPTTNNSMLQNGGLLPTTYQITSISPSTSATVFSSQPMSMSYAVTSSHPMSTSQQVSPSHMLAHQQGVAQMREPLVSAVRPQIRTQPQQQMQSAPREVVAQTSPNVMSQASITSDPQKRKLITQQLVLLLHAHKCQKRNMNGPDDARTDPDVCRLHHCKIMKNTLQHMQRCQNGRQCQESHCVSSRQIIAHWRNCHNPSCPVCLPLRTVSRKARIQQNGLPGLVNGAYNTSLTSPPQPNNVTAVSMGDNTGTVLGNSVGASLIRPTTTNGLGSLLQAGPNQHTAAQRRLSLGQQYGQQQHSPTLQAHLTNQRLANPQQLTNQQLATGQQHQPMNSQMPSPMANRVINTNQSAMMQHQSPTASQSSLSTISPTGSMLNMPQQGSTNESETYNAEDMRSAYASLGLPYNPNGKSIGQFLQQPLQQQGANTAPSNVQKEWHSTVNVQLRKYLIAKLVSAIFPKPDPLVQNDPRMNNLLSYAKKVEGEMFTLANSRSQRSDFIKKCVRQMLANTTKFESKVYALSSTRDEYYQRLAEKIYKIRLELKEKRKQRQVQEQQKQAARAMLSSSEDPMLVSTKPDMINIKVEPMAVPFSSSGAGVSSPVSNSQPSFSVTKNLLQQPSIKIEKKEPVSPEVKPTLPSPAAPPVAAAPAPARKSMPKKIWSRVELKTSLMPLVMKMIGQEESIFLRLPVDPQALNIPDYFDIIKKPMDLSTIRNKLEDGVYNCPWDFVNDVWLMFDNAWLYNKKSSKVHKVCTKLSEMFEAEINVLMKRLGYCCGKKFVFYPNVLVCYSKQTVGCTIAQYQVYYAYENRYTFCDKCFMDITTDIVDLTDEMTGQPLSVPKNQFVQTKNDVLEPEQMTKCKDCERKFHSICVQYIEAIYDSGYVCDGCLKALNQTRKENKYTAKRLPTCKLSMHIEDRVNRYLERKNITGEVIIRVLSFTEKENEIKQGMKERFPEMAAVIPYKCKAIFAFQYCKQQNRELCFFAMQVQEYDSSAPAPNTSRVYISYLDSVYFFTPRDYKTAVYHEILIGYFDHVRILGYKWGHIWACPPAEGDDYIFHAHPPDQKVPKPKRLQDWYKKMLDKSIIEGVVQDYKDIYKDALEKRATQPYELPYFEGDFWTTVLEDCIKECQDEEASLVTEPDVDIDDDVTASALDAAMTSDNPVSSALTPTLKAKKPKGNKTKNPKKNTGRRGGQGVATDLQSRFLVNLEKHRDMFFVIRLKNESFISGVDTQNIVDPDSIISSDLMDARDSFLTMCREKHWEFSSLRRAAYSTMAFLHEIHTTNKDGFVYTCNGCKNQVETRYHCTTCEDFDLCVPCYQKNGHEHKMEKLGLDIEGGESTDSKLSPDEVRKISLQRCIDSLQHASQCKDANCKQSVCEKMKRVVSHTKMCKRKTTGGCPICKQLIALCCYHAKICKESMCLVPFCANIKSKLRMQKQNQRNQQERLLQRRVAQQRGGPAPSVVSSAIARTIGHAQPTQNAAVMRAVSSGPAYSTASTSLLAQQSPVVTGGYTRTLSQPPHQVMQQQQQQQRVMMTNNHQQRVQQMQSQTQSQQLMQHMQRQQQTIGNSVPQPIILNQGTQNVQVVHPLQRPSTQQQMDEGQRPQHVQQRVAQAHAQSVAPMSEEAKNAAKIKVQQIFAALKKGGKTPEEKKQLVQLLKSNPALLQMFIKQKKATQTTVAHSQQLAMPGTSLLSRNPQQASSSLSQQSFLSPLSDPSSSGLLSPHNNDSGGSTSQSEELSRFVDSL